MIRSVFAPQAHSGGKLPAREKEDAGILIQGKLVLEIGECSFVLNTGDSFHFANQTYGWRTPHDEPAIVIWVVSPPVY